jgi:hypothetical protein
METIDITPTWSGIIRVLIAALEDGTDAGKQVAREEVIRLARQYDIACDAIAELLDQSEVTAEFDDAVMVRVPRYVWEKM